MEWRHEIDSSLVFITLSNPEFLMKDNNLSKLAYAMAINKPILAFVSEPNFLPSYLKKAKIIRYINIEPSKLTLEVFETEVYKFLHEVAQSPLENDNMFN